LPRGDQEVLSTFCSNVACKLSLLRLAAMSTAGSG
jgi:hypothetical protein